MDQVQSGFRRLQESLNNEDDAVSSLKALGDVLAETRLKESILLDLGSAPSRPETKSALRRRYEKTAGKNDAQVAWLQARHKQFLEIMLQLLPRGKVPPRAIIRELMKAIRVEGLVRQKRCLQEKFPAEMFDFIVTRLVLPDSGPSWAVKWAPYPEMYADFALAAAKVVVKWVNGVASPPKKPKSENGFEKLTTVFSVLNRLPLPNQAPTDTFVPDATAENYQTEYTTAWLAFLAQVTDDAPKDLVLNVLYALPPRVLPYLSNPLILSTFYQDTFDSHENLSVSIACLSGHFYFLTRARGGEDESVGFYSRLYSLLCVPVFSLAVRTQFLQLLQVCLRSPLLAKAILAQFIKKLLRIACFVPAPNALWILSLVIHLLQKETTPAMLPLIHVDLMETASVDTPPVSSLLDFNLDELGSAVELLTCSLREIELLRRHTSREVRVLASAFESDYLKRKHQQVEPQDFEKLSLSSMSLHQLKRSGKRIQRGKADVEFRRVKWTEAGANFVVT
ncbi:MAG: hypothetical protein KVP17_002248 [Porospora cf. gigantea B]|uniref:uncharacterized protein n=1 Tax=Porospora cf. gigantea B TaxID=2853592 RepID=UPI003571DAE6|nr:MAG: hypothetical protein KVP17_002248 [Porospora cf. gigantea B]